MTSLRPTDFGAPCSFRFATAESWTSLAALAPPSGPTDRHSSARMLRTILFHESKQFFEVQRLLEVADKPVGRLLLGPCIRGEQHHRDVRRARLAAELVHELIAVHRRHVPIQQDQRWGGVGVEIAKGLQPIAGLSRLVTLVFQNVLEGLADICIVIHYQHRSLELTGGHGPPPSGSGARGGSGGG